jgi:hypothetical protein
VTPGLRTLALFTVFIYRYYIYPNIGRKLAQLVRMGTGTNLKSSATKLSKELSLCSASYRTVIFLNFILVRYASSKQAYLVFLLSIFRYGYPKSKEVVFSSLSLF